MPVPTMFGAVGGGFDPAALALFARMTTPPTTARKQLINAVIVTLKGAGAWDRLTGLWVTAAADSQASLLNWKGNTNNLTATNSPTFTADRGYVGAVTSVTTPRLVPALAPNSLGQNDVSLSIWYQQLGAGDNNKWDGLLVAGAFFSMIARDATNLYGGNVNTNSFTGLNAAGAATGLVTASRTASNVTTLYKNGVSVTTNVAASVAPSNIGIPFLAYTPDNVAFTGHDHREAAMAVGASLSAAQAAALYAALEDYMVGVGAA